MPDAAGTLKTAARFTTRLSRHTPTTLERAPREWDTESCGPTPVAASDNTEATIPTEEQERLLRRMDEVRAVLRDSTSLDLIETLLEVLADCEQRLRLVEGDDAVTPELAST